MGRARAALVGMALAALAHPAGAQTRADVWVAYRPGIEEVQALEAYQVGRGLYAVVVNPSTGQSRLDLIDPNQRLSYQSLEPPIPTATQAGPAGVPSGHMALGLETDPQNNVFVSVGKLEGTAPTPLAAIYKLQPGSGPPEWVAVAQGHDATLPMQAPWGLAFHPGTPQYPKGLLYATDARQGRIVLVRNVSGAGPQVAEIVSDDPVYDPVGSDSSGPVPGVTGRPPLGITGIAVCPVGFGPPPGGHLCERAGNLVVVNTSTGILYEVPVFADGTTGEPQFRGSLSARSGVVALEFAPDGTLYYVESGLDRVRSMSQDFQHGLVAEGCPLSAPSDVAVVGSAFFVASRGPLVEGRASFVTENRNPLTDPPPCPLPNVTRVVETP